MKNIYIIDSIHELKFIKKYQKKIKIISYENLYLDDIELLKEMDINYKLHTHEF